MIHSIKKAKFRNLKQILFVVFGIFLFSYSGSQAVFSQNLSEEGEIKLDKVFFLIADDHLEEAVELLDEIESDYCHPNVETECIDAMIHRISILQFQRKFSESSAYLTDAQKLAESLYPDDHVLAVKIYNSYVYQHTMLKELETAEEWSKKSLDKINFLDEEEDGLRIAYTYTAYANLQDEKGNYRGAADLYDKALDSLKEPLNKQKLYAFSYIHNLAGITYRKRGEYGKSMYHYEEAYDYLSDLFPDNHPEIAMSYNNRGTIEYENGDVGSAINYFKQSAKIFEKFHGKNNQRVAAAHNNIGLSYYRLGNYLESAEHLEIAQEIKLNVLGENHPETAIGYSNLASIYRLDDDYEKAISNHEKSLRVRIANLGEDHPDLIPPYSQLGSLYVSFEEYDKGREYYQKAYKIAINKLDKEHADVLNLLIDIGSSYREENNYIEALNYYREANKIVDSGNNLKKAVEKYPDLFILMKSFQGESYHRLYEANDNQNELKRALGFYEQALYGIDEMQYSFQNEASKLRLVDKYYSLYGDAINIADKLYSETGSDEYLKKVFLIAELSRAKITLENLQNNEAKKYAGIPAEVLSRENDLNKNISNVYQKLYDLEIVDASQNMISSLEDSLFHLQRNKESLIETIEENYPEYYNLKFDRELVDLSTVQNSLLSNKETLLTYVIRDENIKIFVISQNEANLVTAEKTLDISDSVTNLRESLMNGENEKFIQLSNELYVQLITPVQNLIKTENIIIVPDQSLHYLPFELLLNSDIRGKDFTDLPYLINNRNISYIPSSTLFNIMNNREGINSNKLLAAAPFYSQDYLADIGSPVVSGLNLNPLPMSGYEVKRIADEFEKSGSLLDFFQNRESEYWLDSEATEKRIKSTDLTNYGYLHFATHAFVNEETPDLSGIYFHSGNDEDGIFFVNDIYNTKLNAELVVLGACETGLGELRKGEGIIGFLRAFIYAGASNLITSQWKVNDQYTSKWMIRFYEEIRKGTSYAKAMQTVKKEFISNPATADPRIWAAFILHGR